MIQRLPDQLWRLGMISVDLSADMGFRHMPQLQFPAVGESKVLQSAHDPAHSIGYRCPYFKSSSSSYRELAVYTFRRFLDRWLETVHVVASIAVIAEEQLILQEHSAICSSYNNGIDVYTRVHPTHLRFSRKWLTTTGSTRTLYPGGLLVQLCTADHVTCGVQALCVIHEPEAHRTGSRYASWASPCPILCTSSHVCSCRSSESSRDSHVRAGKGRGGG